MQIERESFLPAFSTICIFSMVGIIGFAIIPSLRIRFNPSINPNIIRVDYRWPDRSPESIERSVSSAIEGSLLTIKGINGVKSISRSGQGSIELTTDPKVDKRQIRFEILDILRQLHPNLPEGVSYPLVNAGQINDRRNKPVMSIDVYGVKNLDQIQAYIEGNIYPILKEIKGIYQINSYGSTTREWRLAYKPRDLRLYNITPGEVKSAILNRFTEHDLGSVYDIPPSGIGSPEFRNVKLTGANTHSDLLASAPVKKVGHRYLQVRDIASLTLVEKQPSWYYRVNGLNTIRLELIADDSYNVLGLTKVIEREINSLHPTGITVQMEDSAGKDLLMQISSVLAGAVVILIINSFLFFFFSRSKRYLVIVFLSILCSFSIASILYYTFELEIHIHSLVAITASTGMMIIPILVSIDYICSYNSQNLIPGIFCATATVIASLSMVLFFDNEQLRFLKDFSTILIINLFSAVVVSLFFVPALIRKLLAIRNVRQINRSRNKIIARVNSHYVNIIYYLVRYKKLFTGALMLLFGLPIFLVPENFESRNPIATLHQAFFSSETYLQNVKPWVDTVTGGTLRLFLTGTVKPRTGNELNHDTKLLVNITMPEGAGITQMNELVQVWENYLRPLKEIKQFYSSVYTGESANITIEFHEEYEHSGFPYHLKSELETKAVYTGLAEFIISGAGDGFNNHLNNDRSNFSIKIKGYNYTQLQKIAIRMKKHLSNHPRVESLVIDTESRTGAIANVIREFSITDQYRFSLGVSSPNEFNSAISNLGASEFNVGSISLNGEYTGITLVNEQPKISKWGLMNDPLNESYRLKLKELGTLTSKSVSKKIIRNNQQYEIFINYSFNGDRMLAVRVAEEFVTQYSKKLPIGYSMEVSNGQVSLIENRKPLLGILFSIIAVGIVSTILLNSINQGLRVLSTIPTSFIGIFLTGYLLEFELNEGTFLGFAILTGTITGFSILILIHYNRLIRENKIQTPIYMFARSVRINALPIMIGLLALVIGFLPFTFDKTENLLFSMSATIIGGTLFAPLGLVLSLPTYLLTKNSFTARNQRAINRAK